MSCFVSKESDTRLIRIIIIGKNNIRIVRREELHPTKFIILLSISRLLNGPSRQISTEESENNLDDTVEDDLQTYIVAKSSQIIPKHIIPHFKKEQSTSKRRRINPFLSTPSNWTHIFTAANRTMKRSGIISSHWWFKGYLNDWKYLPDHNPPHTEIANNPRVQNWTFVQNMMFRTYEAVQTLL